MNQLPTQTEDNDKDNNVPLVQLFPADCSTFYYYTDIDDAVAAFNELTVSGIAGEVAASRNLSSSGRENN